MGKYGYCISVNDELFTESQKKDISKLAKKYGGVYDQGSIYVYDSELLTPFLEELKCLTFVTTAYLYYGEEPNYEWTFKTIIKNKHKMENLHDLLEREVTAEFLAVIRDDVDKMIYDGIRADGFCYVKITSQREPKYDYGKIIVPQRFLSVMRKHYKANGFTVTADNNFTQAVVITL